MLRFALNQFSLPAGGVSMFLVHGGQIALVFVGFELDSIPGWAGVAAAIAALSLIAWLLALRRWRSIGDTPTSLVATAAQGYAELDGRGKPLEGLPLIAPGGAGLPCLWYRYMIEARDHDGDWHTEETITSDASFILDDDTGQCLVDPYGAEIITSHKQTWTEGSHRYTLWQLLREDRLYVLGEFRTRTALDLEFDRNDDIRQMLADWKQNPESLHQRFDLNNDGKLDMKEWELARSAARREVEARHRELRNSADLHTLGRPDNGRLYLISNLPATQLARRFQLLAWGHLIAFFIALGASVTLFRQIGALS